MSFIDYSRKRVYESEFRSDETLVGGFYWPMLSETTQYDRLAI